MVSIDDRLNAIIRELIGNGITLAQACRRQLEQAELRITELRARTEGGFDEQEIDL